MTRAEHIQALLADYARQRTENELAQDHRTREAIAKVPRIGQLRAESASLAVAAMRSILEQRSEAERVAVAQRMKARGVEINAEIRSLLKSAGFPEDWLEMTYRCPVCRDTAYVGEAPARFCDCFEQRLRLRQHEDGSMAGVDEQNFERFNIDIFPEDNGQRARILKCRRVCEMYADQFPDFRYRNLLLMGTPGLGKTYLLNCIFERVTSRGFSAIRVTAFRMFEAMRKQHVGNDGNFDGFTALVDAPLLLIDDLGTEPMMRNITVEYLFMLLNERIANHRHTVVATNMTAEDIEKWYGQRVASRIGDESVFYRVEFIGTDLRKL